MAAYSFSSLRELLRDQETPTPNVFEGFPPLPSSNTNFYSDSESLKEELEPESFDANKGYLTNSILAFHDDNDGRRAAADTEAKDAMNIIDYAEERKGFKKKERGYVYAKFDENIGKYVLDEADVPIKAGLKGGNGCVKLYFASPDEEDDEEINEKEGLAAMAMAMAGAINLSHSAIDEKLMETLPTS